MIKARSNVEIPSFAFGAYFAHNNLTLLKTNLGVAAVLVTAANITISIIITAATTNSLESTDGNYK